MIEYATIRTESDKKEMLNNALLRATTRLVELYKRRPNLRGNDRCVNRCDIWHEEEQCDILRNMINEHCQ